MFQFVNTFFKFFITPKEKVKATEKKRLLLRIRKKQQIFSYVQNCTFLICAAFNFSRCNYLISVIKMLLLLTKTQCLQGFSMICEKKDLKELFSRGLFVNTEFYLMVTKVLCPKSSFGLLPAGLYSCLCSSQTSYRHSKR